MAKVMDVGEQASETDLLAGFMVSLGGVVGLAINPWFLILNGILSWGWKILCPIMIFYGLAKLGMVVGVWIGKKKIW